MRANRIFVLMRPGGRPGAAQAITRWLRFLLPAAVLLSSPAALPPEAEEDAAVVISVDIDDEDSGPLALADAIARGRSRHVNTSGSPPRSG
jgi:hypothetical protein